VNGVVGPSFQVTFVIFHTCGSYEQCTEPREERKRLLVLFIGTTVLFQLIFIFIYSIFSKKLLILTK